MDGTDASEMLCWCFHCVVNDVTTTLSIAATGVAVVAVGVAIVAAPEIAIPSLAIAGAAGTVSTVATGVQFLNQCSQGIDASCETDAVSLTLGGLKASYTSK